MGEKNKQTWVILASPRDRYQLAALLMHKDVKPKGNKSGRELHRARMALGLLAPHDAILRYKEGVSDTHREDYQTLHKFLVTAENAECVLGWNEKLEINSLHARLVADLLGQLEAGDDSVVDAPVYDERVDIELWKPRGKPLLENPWLFSEALGAVIEEARDFVDFKRLYAKGMEPEPETPVGLGPSFNGETPEERDVS